MPCKRNMRYGSRRICARNARPLRRLVSVALFLGVAAAEAHRNAGRLLAAIALYGVRTFLDAPAHRDCPTCPTHARSDEQTSELQSLMRISYADFVLQNININR